MGTRTSAVAEVEQTLVLATSHLTPHTAGILNALDMPRQLALSWGPFAVYHEGWIFWVPFSDNETDYPSEFAAIFALARANRCKLVRFDCDACEHADLPHWSW